MARSKQQGAGPSLKNVVKKGRERPTRGVLYAVSGWGKTSLSAHFPGAIVLMTRGEDGLRTLMANGLVPEVAHFDDEATTWNEVLLATRELLVHPHEYQTLVIDVVNGAADLCVGHVQQVHFGGSAEKFNEWGRGWKLVPDEWRKLLANLTELNERGMGILLLAHADIRTFKNPEGADYDRYVPRMKEQFWELTEAWADMVLFGQMETFIKADKQNPQRGKATGGQDRVLYCQRTAVADAKNRHGLPIQVYLGQGAAEAHAALGAALAEGKKKLKEGPGETGEVHPTA